ncbi:uncharacterized protein LOC133883393 [Phragmites australis]|uniref:uncharacterized protein LOC133883393 n=1 Tax=Phragmites australis TaxID=29695 RepID=UPI002D78051E|nr:uncharacterized protein LOC133883393 [Phragmites australis]
MAEGNAAASAARPSSGCRGRRCGCGLALGRLVRKLRRQSKMLCTASARHPAAAARCQYDPLSYARNFDFGTALDGDGYSFASRFVLASSARQPQ